MSTTLEPVASWPDAPPLTLDPLLEAERLMDLLSLKLLDTAPENRFDRITRLAADFFHVPIAYVGLMESDRQWLKSSVGGCPTQTARSMTICQYTIQMDEPLIIPDMTVHPISRGHPSVVGEPHARFYAGVPLAGPRGHKVGTFCLVDLAPRKFDEKDVESLIAFAALVEREINLHEIIETQNELLSTRHQLIETQRKLNHELSDAAKYVQLMLPQPLSGEEIIDWHFHPSTHLGGDGLGYRRINDDLLAFYVLDVTGHGLGSALLAVTALELLRNPAAQVDYSRPAAVMDRLNRTFPMKDHAGKFFSAWYGVYSRSARTMTYANAGHPPALLLTSQDGKLKLSKTAPGGSVLGVLPQINTPETTIPFPPTSEIYLFTDGLYELPDGAGGHGSYNEFLSHLEKQVGEGKAAWTVIREWLDQARARKRMDDDVSLLRFATKDAIPS